jgi:hypothetical protein
VDSNKSNKGNPLNMQSLDPEGLYVLPPQLCSERRREFFVRANQILGSYSIICGYSNFGKNWVELEAKKGRFIETTPMRITINDRTIQTTYRKIKEMYEKGVPRLSNYIFLMIYGNFETFLSDLVCDGLTKQGRSSPVEETIRLMMATKWVGKIDRLSQLFDLNLGKSNRQQKFRDLPMEFMGVIYTDPIEFLQKIADIRHRLTHYSGLADSLFLSEFPRCGLSEGDPIFMPVHMPYDTQFFLVLLTDLVDDAFSRKFKWSRTLMRTELLTG